MKYLVEVKYYFVLDVLYISGTFDFIFYIIVLITEIIIHKVNRSYALLFQFYYFYKEYGAGYIIIRFIIGFLFPGIILSVLELVILKELTPNYIIICYVLGKIPLTIIGYDDYKIWIILVISIFQIIFILFYLEILEFNFCSLNKNTKKSIMGRENEQIYNSKDIEIDLKGYDISEIMKKQELEDLEEEKEED